MDQEQQTATVLSGSAVPTAAANNATSVNEPEQFKVAADVDTKVSTDEAQRKVAVVDQIIYSFAFYVIGIPLAIWGFIWYSGIGLGSAHVDGVGFNHSMFAMGIVGIGLIVWGIASTALAAAFQIANKNNHKISNALGVMSWFTLNPFSWSMVRQSNGYVSRKQKAKLAKQQVAANSDDSVDVKSDVQQAEQADVQTIN